MTLQDYSNWLMLYKDEIYKLPMHHVKNLKKLLSGHELKKEDVPDIQILPSLDASEYFKKMYKNGKISIQFPESTETGSLLEYNYSDYGDFIPPQYLEKTWITGEVDLFSRKVNAKELNYYVRPFATTGIERSKIGNAYKKQEVPSSRTDINVICPDKLGEQFENPVTSNCR